MLPTSSLAWRIGRTHVGIYRLESVCHGSGACCNLQEVFGSNCYICRPFPGKKVVRVKLMVSLRLYTQFCQNKTGASHSDQTDIIPSHLPHTARVSTAFAPLKTALYCTFACVYVLIVANIKYFQLEFSAVLQSFVCPKCGMQCLRVHQALYWTRPSFCCHQT